MKETVKITESKLRKIVKESIEKYLHGMRDVSNIVTDRFSLAPVYRSALFEAAFMLLGYDRFAVDGEIAGKDIPDNPWDDAYAIIDWAIKNKGLDQKYLGKVSEQYSGMSNESFKAYCDAVQRGKEFWFTKEELSEIFSKLPPNLRSMLVRDMVNVGRIEKINDTVNRMAAMNGGKNMEQFFDALKELLKGKKWNRQTFQEPVKQALKSSNILQANTNLNENTNRIQTSSEKKKWGTVYYYTGNGFKFALYIYNDDLDTIYLSNVHVDEIFRRKGIGNNILNLAEQQAIKHGAKIICLKCLINSWVYEWYKRNGYKDFSIDKDNKYIWLKKML